MPRPSARHCLFLVFLFGGGFFCWKGNYSLFIVHSSFATKAQVCCLVRNAPPSSPGVSPALLPSYLFTLTFFVCKALTCCLVRYAPPSSSSRREEEERRARCRRRRGFGADEDGPVLRQDGFLQGGKRVQVWYRPECPLPLFPLPLPWRARCPLLLHSSLTSYFREARCRARRARQKSASRQKKDILPDVLFGVCAFTEVCPGIGAGRRACSGAGRGTTR